MSFYPAARLQNKQYPVDTKTDGQTDVLTNGNAEFQWKEKTSR